MVADNTTTITPDGAVLYIDHARHLSPITLTYHATASRHLTSGRSDIIPPSTSVEVETAYCPRCLTFCDAASASTSLGVCQKDSGGCKDCPICLSPISISIDQHPSTETHLICQYICGHCSWSSHSACGVSVNADKLLEYSNIHDDETETKRLVVISEITTELEACFQGKVCSRNQSGDALFHSIVDMWTQKEQEEDRRKRMMISTTALVNEGKKGYEKTTWSLGALEQSLTEKKRDLDSPHINDCKVIDAKLPLSTENDSQVVDKVQLLRPTPQQIAAQMSLVINVPRCREDLLPLPVRYRTRVSRRCRSELAAGRTGILVKPKLNPLEGDTSLRAGHGQWWKKDSSAVHVVPRVQICRSGTDPATGKVAALLKVKNPTMSMIRLRFSSPSYPDDGVFIDEKELENILIDPFMETAIAQAELCSSSSLSSITPSDWIELESAEDLLLDIGKQYEDDPQEVKSWEAVSIFDALHNDSLPQFNVIASRRDTSWVEMILPDAVTTGIADGDQYPTNNYHLAIPLSMQIEVGNGSWEASLIKRKDVSEESQKDLVDLDLVVLLRS